MLLRVVPERLKDVSVIVLLRVVPERLKDVPRAEDEIARSID